jgi:DNA replication initiation complex subunit (GINS family)
MSTIQRLTLLAGAIVVIVVGFVVFSGGSDDGDKGAATTTATAPAATTTTAVAAEPEPASATIEVRGGKPAGGVKTITLRKGDRAAIVVTSPDTTAEVHLHGYDIKRDLKAGGRVRFSFTANAEGIFEMELEDTATQIAKIEVRPG